MDQAPSLSIRPRDFAPEDLPACRGVRPGEPCIVRPMATLPRGYRLLLALAAFAPAATHAQITDRAAFVAPLAADTLLLKGYGFADLQWDVPTPADGRASYEIGSMIRLRRCRA